MKNDHSFHRLAYRALIKVRIKVHYSLMKTLQKESNFDAVNTSHQGMLKRLLDKILRCLVLRKKNLSTLQRRVSIFTRKVSF